LQFTGNLSASANHTSQITNFTAAQPAISSGTYQIPQAQIGNATGNAILNWQKIGNIITVNGYINMSNASGGFIGEIPLPIYNASIPISNFQGNGTVDHDSATSSFFPIIVEYGTDSEGTVITAGKFVCTIRLGSEYASSAATLNSLGNGSSFPGDYRRIKKNAYFRVSFSYRYG
jgi:hypothetical protein